MICFQLDVLTRLYHWMFESLWQIAISSCTVTCLGTNGTICLAILKKIGFILLTLALFLLSSLWVLGGIRSINYYWQCAILATLGCIWQEQSANVFINKHLTPHLFWDRESLCWIHYGFLLVVCFTYLSPKGLEGIIDEVSFFYFLLFFFLLESTTCPPLVFLCIFSLSDKFLFL